MLMVKVNFISISIVNIMWDIFLTPWGTMKQVYSSSGCLLNRISRADQSNPNGMDIICKERHIGANIV